MKLRQIILVLCIALAISVTAVRAQDSKQNPQQADPSAPIPPMNSGLGGGYQKPPTGAARGVGTTYDPQPYDPSQVTPDQNTLAGAEMFGVGSLQHTRNIFDPAFSVSELGETGQPGPGVSTSQGLMSTTLVGGSLSFDRTWDIFHATIVYNGGETFYVGPGSRNYQFHNLTFAETADWGRWHILVRDNFVATPGAEFTGSGMGGPGLVAQLSTAIGNSLSSVSQSFTPTETIETGNTMRYMDSVLGQGEYSFSRRSAVTIAASYGILHFGGTGFVDSDMLTTQAGYDYLLDPNNSIAILGSYGKIDYTGSGVSTSDYTAAFAYGRKITGHLAFQAGAGPQIISIVNSLNTSGAGNFHLVNYSINSALTYERRRGGVSANFMSGLTAGSGVFLGAHSYIFSGSGHYQFTRFLGGICQRRLLHQLQPGSFGRHQRPI